MTAVIQLILTAFFFNVKVFLLSKMGKTVSFFELTMRAKRGRITWPTSLGPFLASFLLQGQWNKKEHGFWVQITRLNPSSVRHQLYDLSTFLNLSKPQFLHL